MHISRLFAHSKSNSRTPSADVKDTESNYSYTDQSPLLGTFLSPPGEGFKMMSLVQEVRESLVSEQFDEKLLAKQRESDVSDRKQKDMDLKNEVVLKTETINESQDDLREGVSLNDIKDVSVLEF